MRQSPESLTIYQQWAVRLRDLRRAMLDYEPRIVHFCGHGEINGLMVENDDGEAVLVNSEALAGLFELFTTQVECVILNACYSESQAESINEHIKYVIGMRKEIQDRAAIEFAVGFYDALGAGRTVEEAFRFGCNAIQLYDIPEHLTPILKRRTAIKVDITGQWNDPADNDTVFFKQMGDRVIGFYNYDGRNCKVGIYIGTLKGRIFKYSWRWLNNEYEGHGQMILSDDGERLSGDWWYGNKQDDIEHVGYRRVSDDMPLWLSNSDFNEV